MNAIPNKEQNEGGRLLNAVQVAETMNVVSRYVLQLAQRGELPSLRIGPKCIRFRREDVEAFLESKLTGKEAAE